MDSASVDFIRRLLETPPPLAMTGRFTAASPRSEIAFWQIGRVAYNEVIPKNSRRIAMSVSESITEWDLLNHIVQSDHSEWPTALAEAILQIDMPPEDRQRLHELLEQNNRRDLSDSEKRTLKSYRNVSLVLDILRSKARLALRNRNVQA